MEKVLKKVQGRRYLKMLLENIRISFKAVASDKLRSFFTIMGIIIGIASLVAMASIMQGTDEQIRNSLTGTGNNTVDIALYDHERELRAGYDEIPNDLTELPERLKQNILSLGSVRAVSFIYHREHADNVFYKNKNASRCSVTGIDKDYFGTAGYRLKEGRELYEDEFTSGSRICILDVKAASLIFGTEKGTGEVLFINGTPFTVAGIVEETDRYEPEITTLEDYYLYADTSGGAIFIPSSVWSVVYGYDEPQRVLISAVGIDKMADAGRRTEGILNRAMKLDTAGRNGIQYKSAGKMIKVKEIQDMSAPLNNMLILAAVISLIIGCVCVMNHMLVSVAERTGEISIKRMLGAKERDIKLRFMTESVVLAMCGGVFGFIAGTAFAFIFSAVTGIPAAFSLMSILASIIFPVLVGTVSGIIPAVKASKLNPADILKLE